MLSTQKVAKYLKALLFTPKTVKMLGSVGGHTQLILAAILHQLPSTEAASEIPNWLLFRATPYRLHSVDKEI